MRQKIISLSLDTYELASKKANFSAWVRKKLIEEAGNIDYRYEYQCEMCERSFFRSASRVLGVRKWVDCEECGGVSYATGVKE